MIKNDETIINNFFGMDYHLLDKVYEMLKQTTIDINDNMLYRGVVNTFEDYVKKVVTLYGINSKGLSLKTNYTEKILKDNKEFALKYIDNHLKESDAEFVEGFFHNCPTYDLSIIQKVDAIFNQKKLDNQLVMDFIDSYNKASEISKERFIAQLIKNNYYYVYLSPNYIPGINFTNEDFNELIIHIFGDKIYNKYKLLSPIRKIGFILKMKKDIVDSYNKQIKYEKNKANKVKKRKIGK